MLMRGGTGGDDLDVVKRQATNLGAIYRDSRLGRGKSLGEKGSISCLVWSCDVKSMDQ